MTVEEMEARILAVSGIEGVTFLGGEPFEQAEAFADLGRRVQGAGLSVMTFTGYVLEDILKSSRRGWHELLSVAADRWCLFLHQCGDLRDPILQGE